LTIILRFLSSHTSNAHGFRPYNNPSGKIVPCLNYLRSLNETAQEIQQMHVIIDEQFILSYLTILYSTENIVVIKMPSFRYCQKCIGVYWLLLVRIMY